MPVDPELQALLDVVNAGGPVELGPDSAPVLRTMYSTMGAMYGPGPDTVEATDLVIRTEAGDSVSLRVYRPAGAQRPAVLVWFHGGGFVIGDLDTADGECRHLCESAGVVVVSVGYPLAPEHPFPVAIDVCEGAVRWVAAHGDELGAETTRLAVGGDSAGGNLATVVSRRLTESGDVPIAVQLLVYPVTDFRTYPAPGADVGDFVHASLHEHAEGHLLTLDTMRFFRDRYLGDADGADPDASPLVAASLEGLPPAVVLTCEFDPLRDEGEAYAAALAAAGVEVECHRQGGGIHGMLAMVGLSAGARELMDRASDGLTRALSDASTRG